MSPRYLRHLSGSLLQADESQGLLPSLSDRPSYLAENMAAV